MGSAHDRRYVLEAGVISRRGLLRTIGLSAGAGVAGSFLGSSARLVRAQADAGDETEQVTPEGSVVLSQSTEFHEINPHRELWSDDSSFHFAIFDSLIQRDDEMNLVPVLAESYENTGPTEWTFKLRQGITFHNGEPLTVETIQWNVADAIAEGKKRDVTFNNFDRVEIIDDSTFKLITKEPDPLVPQRLIRFFILPAAYFEEVGEAGFMEQPVGTGAYEFVERVLDSHIAVTANENYWQRNAFIKDATFRIIPDVSTALSALRAGEVDFVFSPPPDQFEALDGAEETKAVSVVSDRVAYCQLFPDSPQGNGELNDPRVRQALNYAINVDGIIEFLLAGHSQRISTILPTLSFAYAEDLAPYPYDPERAQALLAEAGLGNGFNLVVEVPSAFILPKTVEIGQVMQEDLGKVGITVDLRPTELGTMVNERAERQIAPVYLWSWGSDFLDPEPFYRGILHTASPYTFFGKPEWDALIDEAAATLDEARRQEIYHQLQRETYDDPPWLFMYAIENIYAMQANLEMTPRTDERVIVRNMRRSDG